MANNEAFPAIVPGAGEDRRRTRDRLIEVAGEMFAAKGFEGTTGKEICERAGVNPAAVNYHFGGLEGLYEAVLLAAGDRIVAAEHILQALAAATTPEERLRAVIRLVVRAILAIDSSSWILRLISREVTSPTPFGARLLASTAQPRVEMARALVGELIGLPPDHPAVALATISVAAPMQMLLIADRSLMRSIHPALDLSPGLEDRLVEHFFTFATAGLEALNTASHRGSRAKVR